MAWQSPECSAYGGSGLYLLVQEHPALYHLMHQGSESVVLASQRRHDLFDHFAVGELKVGARGIDQQFLSKVAGQLVLVGEQELLVIVDILELAAIVCLAAMFDVRTAVEGTSRVAGQVD